MKNNISKLRFGIFAAALMAALPVIAFSQPSLFGRMADLHDLNDGETSEKLIVVDANVNVSMCVTQGNLRINGWNRKEVRVFVKDGSKFSFKVLQKDMQSDSPVWITLAGLEKTKGKYPTPTECIWGEVIEM